MTGVAILITAGIVLGAAGATVALSIFRFGNRRVTEEPPKALAAFAQAQVLQVIFEGSADGFLVCDEAGSVLAANPAARKLLGLEPADLVGQSITRWIPRASQAGPHAAGAAGIGIATGEVHIACHPSGGFNARVDVLAPRGGGLRRYVVALRDVTELRRAQSSAEQSASFDSLTGLPNRLLFRDRLKRAMGRSKRSGKPMALFFLDLDRFKVVNDSLGHEAGDRLLQHVAQVLSACLRGTDSILLGSRDAGATLSRIGGDEFTVIVEEVGGAEGAAIVAQRMLDSLATPFRMGEEEVQVSASIGISLYPTDDIDLDGIIRHTDMAMYRSKSLGRNTFSFFSDDLNAAVSARLSMEGSLRRALERREFCLHYQPKADLASGQITGCEALIRWHCPGKGMVQPDRFIAVLEDTGLIVQVGAWVIREACSQLARWDAMGFPRITMAVNVSARQLRHPFLVSLVQDSLQEAGLDPSRLELELTESLLMEDTEGNKAVLAAFHKLGVRLAIDDFGTGHSSLSYLRRLDVHTLKIDRSFVMQLPDNAEDAAIASAIVAMGHSLGMKIVAEGVETEAQASFLRKLGCGDMQGWLLSKALPSDSFAAWLDKHHRAFLARTQPKRFQSDDAVELPDIRIPEIPL